MIKEQGGPAFPNGTGWNHVGDWVGGGDDGMTLRDYFAAKAMQGLLASPRTPTEDKVVTDTVVAKYAYLMAEAMLRARDET
jgi:hypothetical protein